MTCNTCSGHPQYIGTLGTTAWFRCIQCGDEWGIDHADLNDDLEEIPQELDDYEGELDLLGL